MGEELKEWKFRGGKRRKGIQKEETEDIGGKDGDRDGVGDGRGESGESRINTPLIQLKRNEID